MPTRIQALLNELTLLDLSTDPYSQARGIVKEILSGYPVMDYTLHPGKEIDRARTNEDNRKFSQSGELSYKPQKYNNTYPRASTPQRTMFYGALMPEKQKEADSAFSRVAAIAEVTPFLRDPSKTGNSIVTVGKWVTLKNIDVIVLTNHKPYFKAQPYLAEMYSAYLHELSRLPTEQAEDAMLVSDFFASEFSKPVDAGYSHLNYILSAVFAEIVTDLGYEGVLYPGVRTSGQGLNVAFLPESADSKLILDRVGEFTVDKPDHRVTIDNKSFCLTNKSGKSFLLEDLK